MIQTLFLLGAGYLIGNDQARNKFEVSLKNAVAHGLANLQNKGFENVKPINKTTTEKSIASNSFEPSSTNALPQL